MPPSVAQLDLHPTGDQEVGVGFLPGPATFFHGDWNIFYGHSLHSADWRRANASFWQKKVHKYWFTTSRTKSAQENGVVVNWPCSTWPQWFDWAVKPQHKQTKMIIILIFPVEKKMILGFLSILNGKYIFQGLKFRIDKFIMWPSFNYRKS